ncbi:MAG: FAD-binding protein [Actinomycetales bacterium]|nr:FAD-binding protein [Actinomycetales bacterium]
MTIAGRNWAGSYEYAAPGLVAARTVEEARAAIRRAHREGGRVRALGTRHSFTDLPDTTGTLVSVLDLEPDPQLTPAGTVAVSAGVRYGVLAGWLEQQGRALHNLGSLPHISVAGATATGTHGSGLGNGVQSTALRAIEYLGADAEPHRVEPGDPDFPALAVGLGAFGVVTRVELATQPSYRMRQDVYSGLGWDALLADPRAVLGAAYSVSVFMSWGAELDGQVWRKARLDRDGEEAPETVLDARRRDDDLVGIAEGLEVDNLTEQGGRPGPWNLRLPHFRADATPSAGAELQTEYFVPFELAAEALAALRPLGELIRSRLLVTELRTTAADDLLLSGSSGRETLAIHFTWQRDLEGVGAIVPEIEAALAPLGARPHWGKVHGLDAAGIARVTPGLAAAREVFERVDPEGMFSNAHLERLGVRLPR